jgi:histidine kinase
MIRDAYEDLHPVSEGETSIVYRARRRVDGRSVLLKLLRGESSPGSNVRHLRRELELGSLVAHEALLSPNTLVEGSEPALVFPDRGGCSTLSMVADGPLDLEIVLQIGISVAGGLAALHGHGVLHGNVTPINILYAHSLAKCWLIDFTFAHRRGHPFGQHVLRSLADLAYGSPEQSGRTNRSIDERSDIYALGATLFHLAVGRPPFVGPDPLRLIHAHLARPAPSPRSLNGDLPEDFAAVLLHCLQKDPDDRYQSAEGLRLDLLACERRRKAGDVTFFSPAREDRSGRPRMTEALVGRESEMAFLLRAFQDTAIGRSRFVCLKGWSGIGKSRLAQELLPAVTTASATWISGKHEMLGRGRPYSGLAQALSRWVRQMVNDPAESSGLLREKLQAALGEQAGLLAALVPELEHLLGSLPRPPDLPAAETELRMQVLLQRLFSALASPHAPLVLFLDDLQWADSATLQMLAPILTDSSCRHVLVVGAWRVNEVGPDHPLTGLISELQGRGAILEHLQLGPLNSAATLEVVARSLRTEPEPVRDLAGAIYAATGGSPFYVSRLLAAIWDDGELMVTSTGLQWNRQASSLAEAPLDAVVFLGERLRRLEASVQRVLSIGAWVGSRFRALDVASVLAMPVATVVCLLDQDVVDDVVRRVDDFSPDQLERNDGLDLDQFPVYSFLHDRVQQAAAELTDDEEVALIRLSIARHFANGNRVERFEAIDHALHAGTSLQDPEERLRFAGLAALAGRQAAEAAAFDAARRMFEAGIAWTGDTIWEKDPSLALDLAIGAAEASYLAGDRAGMERQLARVLRFSSNPLARIRADEIATMSHVAANQISASIDRAAVAVRQAGGTLDGDPGMPQLLLGLLRSRWALQGGRRSHERLLQLPLCTDPLVQARMRLEASLFSPAFYGRPRLFPMLSFIVLRETLRHGVTPESCVALMVYGIVRASTGDLHEGIGYGRVALALQMGLPDQRLRFRTEHIWNAHLRFWIEPWHACRDDLARIHRGCWENGDMEYASFAAFMSCTLGLHTGEPLEQLHQRNAQAIASISSHGQQTMLHTTRMHHQIIENLLGRSQDPLLLQGEAYDEVCMEAVHRDASDRVNLHCLAVSRAVLFLFFGDLLRAAKVMRVADAWDSDSRSNPIHVYGRFVDSLAHAAIGDSRRAHKQLAELRRWCQIGDVNLEHRICLVEAELAARLGNVDTAIRAWERSIALSEMNGFPHERGLAFHRAACFHERAGNGEMARLCMAEACQSYAEWGAVSLVKAFSNEEFRVESSLDLGKALDLNALLGAARRIAGEVQASGVTAMLLEGVVLLAGATSAVLWRRDTDEPGFRETLLAAITPDGVEVSTLNGQVSLMSPLLSEGLRQVEPFDVPLHDETWQQDPALRGRNVRSALVVPIQRGGRVSGVVLVLHQHLEGAFPVERVEPIQALVAQAGIALENAFHYEELDNRVRERTAELLVARKEAEAERDRADRLLFNVLPAPIAEELKRTGQVRPLSIPSATVMFSDFTDFTKIAAISTPEALLLQLERCFGAFDEICHRHGITKIKTIGDGYMAVGGLLEPHDQHEFRVVRAALEMVDWIRSPNDDLPPPPFHVRIGVNTGPLVAGVIGKSRFLYDVWGDTVNVAARLEEMGESCRVNLSQATRDRLTDCFLFRPRGEILVKGKGSLPMYFVESFSSD